MASNDSEPSTKPERQVVTIPMARERRRVPRVILQRRVALRSSAGHVLHATAHDISWYAVQVRCDRTAAYFLNPAGAGISRKTGPRIDIRLGLPCNGGLVELGAACRMIYFSMVDEDTVAFALEFRSFEPGGPEALMQFLEEQSSAPKSRIAGARDVAVRPR